MATFSIGSRIGDGNLPTPLDTPQPAGALPTPDPSSPSSSPSPSLAGQPSPWLDVGYVASPAPIGDAPWSPFDGLESEVEDFDFDDGEEEGEEAEVEDFDFDDGEEEGEEGDFGIEDAAAALCDFRNQPFGIEDAAAVLSALGRLPAGEDHQGPAVPQGPQPQGPRPQGPRPPGPNSLTPPKTPSPGRRNGRKAGGAVKAPVRPPAPTERERCQRCLKLVPKKCFADHMKAHRLDNEGVRTSDDRRCGNCAAKSRLCKVALDPSAPGMNTLRCQCCLRYKETCDFRSTYRQGPQAKDLHRHPALL